MNNLVLITGMGRAGVSIIGGILHACGGHGGRMLTAREYDGRELYESALIHSTMTEPTLRAIGADPHGQFPVPLMERCRAIAPLLSTYWRWKTRKALENAYHRVPFYASPLSCLMWPIWNAAFPHARWIVVRRARSAVVDACMRTGFMDAHHTEEGWNQLADIFDERIEEMLQFGLRVLQIWPDKLFDGNTGEAEWALKGLGLAWNAEAVERILHPRKKGSGHGNTGN